MAVVNELVTKFTFKGGLKPLKDFQKGTRAAVVSLGKYGLALGAATLAAGLWANKTLQGAETLVRLAQNTDLSIAKLQELQYIAQQNGVEANTFASNIESLGEKIGEAATQGNEDFNRLGVSVRDSAGNIRSTSEVLGDLTKSFQGLSKSEQISFAGKLGIDKNLINSFSKTDEELNKLRETAAKFAITKEQSKELDKYYASTKNLGSAFTSVSRQVALQFAPSMGALSDNITEFLADFGKGFGAAFGQFFKFIGNLIGGFDDLISATIGWKPILAAFGAALTIAFPIIPIIAGIGLLLVSIEDLIVGMRGGKSVIVDFFKEAFDIDIVGKIDRFTNSFSSLKEMIKSVAILFRPLLKLINNTFKPLENIPGIPKIFSDSNKALDGLDRELIPSLGNKGSVPMPLPSQRNNQNNNTNNNMTNSINIEVRSNDPQAAGLAVSTALNRELENASFNFSKNGGR